MSGSSVPPPTGNPGVGAWYALQRERERNAALERKVTELETKMLLEFGKIAGELRDMKLRLRRSGHDLEELKEWHETSEVRDLRKELAEAQRKLGERPKRDTKWDARTWALISAVILTLVTAIAAALTHTSPAPSEAPGIPLHH